MSIKIMSWVWENGPSDPTERLIMLALADYSNDEGVSYPSMIGLAEKACVTERGARGIVRRLEGQGWLEIKTGGGRGGKNVYRITGCKPGTPNPESETGNKRNPERGDTKPGTRLHETRNLRSAEPSGTVKEPSLSKKEAQPVEILTEVASADAASSFVAFRKQIKKPLTATAAGRLRGALLQIKAQGGDPDDALGMAEERGWQSIKPEWYFKDTANAQSPQPNRQTSASDTLRYQLDVAGRMRRPSSENCF